MNQFIFHSEFAGVIRDAVHAALSRVRVAMQELMRVTSVLVVFGLLVVAVLAVKLVAIAVSNASVADALARSALFF